MGKQLTDYGQMGKHFKDYCQVGKRNNDYWEMATIVTDYWQMGKQILTTDIQGSPFSPSYLDCRFHIPAQIGLESAIAFKCRGRHLLYKLLSASKKLFYGIIGLAFQTNVPQTITSQLKIGLHYIDYVELCDK